MNVLCCEFEPNIGEVCGIETVSGVGGRGIADLFEGIIESVVAVVVHAGEYYLEGY